MRSSSSSSLRPQRPQRVSVSSGVGKRKVKAEDPRPSFRRLSAAKPQ